MQTPRTPMPRLVDPEEGPLSEEFTRLINESLAAYVAGDTVPLAEVLSLP